MPRTDLTPQSSGRLTILSNPTRVVPDMVNGNSFANPAFNVVLYFINSSAGVLTVTVDIPGMVEGENLPNKAYAIPATGRAVIGPFPSMYNQTVDGLAHRVLFNVSVATGVTVEVLLIPMASSGV